MRPSGETSPQNQQLRLIAFTNFYSNHSLSHPQLGEEEESNPCGELVRLNTAIQSKSQNEQKLVLSGKTIINISPTSIAIVIVFSKHKWHLIGVSLACLVAQKQNP